MDFIKLMMKLEMLNLTLEIPPMSSMILMNLCRCNQTLMLQTYVLVQAKKNKIWVKRSGIQEKVHIFPDPEYAQYKDSSLENLFELFFDEEIFENILVQQVDMKQPMSEIISSR